eukprot:254829_1
MGGIECALCIDPEDEQKSKYDTDETKKNIYNELRQANEQLMKCYKSAEWDKFADCYTKDCVLMPSNSPVLLGHDAVRNVFSGAYNAGIKQVKLQIQEAYTNGYDRAFERGNYIFYSENGDIVDKGKYCVFWKRINGKWKLHTDMFSTMAKDPTEIEQIIIKEIEQVTINESGHYIFNECKENDVGDILNEANKNLIDCYAKQDWDGMAKCYTKKCCVLPDQSIEMFGAESVKALFSSVCNEMGIKKIALKSEDTYSMGEDKAFERGSYNFYNDKGEVMDEGKYIVFWLKEDGQFKLHSDMFSSNKAKID